MILVRKSALEAHLLTLIKMPFQLSISHSRALTTFQAVDVLGVEFLELSFVLQEAQEEMPGIWFVEDAGVEVSSCTTAPCKQVKPIKIR